MGKYYPKKHDGIRSNFETSHLFFIQKEVFKKGLKSSSPQEQKSDQIIIFHLDFQ